MSLPRLWVQVVEFKLVICDGLAVCVEYEEARGSSALVDAANKPLFVLLVFDMLSTSLLNLRLGGERLRGQVAVLYELDFESI